MGAAEQEADLRRVFTENRAPVFKSARQDDDPLPRQLDEHMRSFCYHDVCLANESRVDGYLELERVLCAAYDQASAGKGKERHAAGDEFNAQPILTIGRLLKSADGEAYQAIKKTREALMMHRRGNTDAAIRELLGAINYLAAVAILVSEEGYARDLADIERAAVEEEVEISEITAMMERGVADLPKCFSTGSGE